MMNTHQHIETQFERPDSTHEPKVVAFVNSRSGGQQGRTLLPQFRTYLPDQTFDLSEEGGPKKGLLAFKDYENVRVLSCGGDGTGRWILETIDRLNLPHPPTLGILPLGTGNDIARVFGWGGGYENGEPIEPTIEAIKRADIVYLDRWSLTSTPTVFGQPLLPEEPIYAVMNNYLSIGWCDAKIAFDFHHAREENQAAFTDRKRNKLKYLQFGVENLASGSPVKSLAEVIDVEVDDTDPPRVLDVSHIQGLIVLNIPSYSGGMDMWGPDYKKEHHPVSFNDGFLEIVGVQSIAQLGAIGSGMSHGVRLAQTNQVKITYRADTPPLPAKVDGEPWLQRTPSMIEIKFLNQGRLLMSDCPFIKPLSIKNPELFLQCKIYYETAALLSGTALMVIKVNRIFIYKNEHSRSPMSSIRLNDIELISLKRRRFILFVEYYYSSHGGRRTKNKFKFPTEDAYKLAITVFEAHGIRIESLDEHSRFFPRSKSAFSCLTTTDSPQFSP